MPNNMQKNWHGYTLIELLFIIIIIGIIAVLVINAYQQRTSNVKVNKAALQMQQLLQAAMVYYNDVQCWPGDNTGCVPFPPPNFNKYYAPINGTVNPWGSEYLYQVDSNQNFTVLAKNVPLKSADKLFALLPGATKTCGSTTCDVGSSLTSTNQIALVGIGYIPNLKDDNRDDEGNKKDPTTVQTASYTCPAGLKEASLVVGFSAIKANDFHSTCSWEASNIINELYTKDITCQASPPYYCTFKLQAEAVTYSCGKTSTVNYGTMDTVYLFYCHN